MDSTSCVLTILSIANRAVVGRKSKHVPGANWVTRSDEMHIPATTSASPPPPSTQNISRSEASHRTHICNTKLHRKKGHLPRKHPRTRISPGRTGGHSTIQTWFYYAILQSQHVSATYIVLIELLNKSTTLYERLAFFCLPNPLLYILWL